MNDMSATILAKSDQINAADLVGGPITVTIREVRIKADEEQPVTLLLEGYDRAFRPCKGVRRLLVNAWGADAKNYIKCSLTLFRDADVTWAGKKEGGIRVSHMSHIKDEFVEWMRTSRSATKPYKIKPLVLEQKPAAKSKQTPEEWAKAHRDAIDEASCSEDIDNIEKGGAKAMAKLEAEHPTIHAELTHALQVRRSALAQEGRADEDHGDQHDGTETASDDWAA